MQSVFSWVNINILGAKFVRWNQSYSICCTLQKLQITAEVLVNKKNKSFPVFNSVMAYSQV